MKHHLITSIALGSLLSASISHAALVFSVTTDTSSLIGDPSAPFALDFQFTDGSGLGDANNTVMISNFQFGGGSWTGADPGPISLSDTTFLSEFFQGFTPGTSLKFDVSMTTALDVGPIPDEFSFAILDSTLSEIPTHGIGDALLSADIDSSNPSITTFSSDLGRTLIDIPAPIVSFASVPETGIPAGLMAGVCGLLFLMRHRQTSRVTSKS